MGIKELQCVCVFSFRTSIYVTTVTREMVTITEWIGLALILMMAPLLVTNKILRKTAGDLSKGVFSHLFMLVRVEMQIVDCLVVIR